MPVTTKNLWRLDRRPRQRQRQRTTTTTTTTSFSGGPNSASGTASWPPPA